jgi:hypothetical protein
LPTCSLSDYQKARATSSKVCMYVGRAESTVIARLPHIFELTDDAKDHLSLTSG